MTAEVAILNRQGVAMAADSAATIAFSSGNKITSANKVFALSKYHPVGIMVYGTATFMRMPWETVIKQYRAGLAESSFSSLPEYADAFLDHLRSAPQLATEDDQKLHITINLRGYYELIAEQIGERFDSDPDAEISKIIRDEIRTHHSLWKAAPKTRYAPRDAIARVRAKTKAARILTRASVFEQVPLSDTDVRQLNEIAVWLFTRCPSKLPRPGNSGIVIVGFGEDDLYPRMRAFDVDGRVAGTLHAVQRETMDIGVDYEAAIVPFAQREVVDTFLDGVDPEYQRAIEHDFNRILTELPGIVLGHIDGLDAAEKDRIKTRLEATVQKQFADYIRQLADRRHRRQARPVIDMIRMLPKEELAEVAEAFVSLTSLKRRVSLDSETVGGPIDVAVISKGDGLIWIKRKHYFDPALNQQFFSTYYDGRTNAKKDPKTSE